MKINFERIKYSPFGKRITNRLKGSIIMGALMLPLMLLFSLLCFAPSVWFGIIMLFPTVGLPIFITYTSTKDAIIQAKTVYVVGLRTCEPLADFLSFYLNMIRGNVVVLRTTSASEMFEQMIRIDENDVLIGISFPRYSMSLSTPNTSV